MTFVKNSRQLRLVVDETKGAVPAIYPKFATPEILMGCGSNSVNIQRDTKPRYKAADQNACIRLFKRQLRLVAKKADRR